MLDIKNNYKNKYATQRCRKCNQEDETQDHVLSACEAIHTTEDTKVYAKDLFDNNREILQSMCSSLNQGLRDLETQMHTQ